MAVLLPRLPTPVAEATVQRFLESGPEAWPSFNPAALPQAVRFAPTGGMPIASHQLGRLRRELEALAKRHEFGGVSSRSAFAQFDAEASIWIAQDELFDCGEALRDDVWNFVGAVLAPDIVHWRFGSAMERYLGGVRNMLQRLWVRGRALDRGADHHARWQLVKGLTEDALVQVTERPSIGGNHVLARAVGEAWLRVAAVHGRAAMEPIMRTAILRIRIRNEIRSLSELPADQLAKELDEIFAAAARSVAEG